MSLTRKQKTEIAQRVDHARQTIEFFGSLPGQDPDFALRDFLGDLMHYCDAQDINLYTEIRMAEVHHTAEVNGEQ